MTPVSDAAPEPERRFGRSAVLVFVAFALGYFSSAVVRAVIATLSPVLTQEFGLTAAFADEVNRILVTRYCLFARAREYVN